MCSQFGQPAQIFRRLIIRSIRLSIIVGADFCRITSALIDPREKVPRTCNNCTLRRAHSGNHFSAFRRTHSPRFVPAGHPSNWLRGCKPRFFSPKLSAKAITFGASSYKAVQISSSFGSGSSPSHHSTGQVVLGLSGSHQSSPWSRVIAKVHTSPVFVVVPRSHTRQSPSRNI